MKLLEYVIQQLRFIKNNNLMSCLVPAEAFKDIRIFKDWVFPIIADALKEKILTVEILENYLDKDSEKRFYELMPKISNIPKVENEYYRDRFVLIIFYLCNLFNFEIFTFKIVEVPEKEEKPRKPKKEPGKKRRKIKTKLDVVFSNLQEKTGNPWNVTIEKWLKKYGIPGVAKKLKRYGFTQSNETLRRRLVKEGYVTSKRSLPKKTIKRPGLRKPKKSGSKKPGKPRKKKLRSMNTKNARADLKKTLKKKNLGSLESFLRLHYTTNKESTSKIANLFEFLEFSVSSGTVGRWLKEFKIPLRTKEEGRDIYNKIKSHKARTNNNHATKKRRVRHRK